MIRGVIWGEIIREATIWEQFSRGQLSGWQLSGANYPGEIVLLLIFGDLSIDNQRYVSLITGRSVGGALLFS